MSPRAAGDGDRDGAGDRLSSCRSLPALTHPRRWLRRAFAHPSLPAFTSQKYCSTQPAPSGSAAPPRRGSRGDAEMAPSRPRRGSAPHRGGQQPPRPRFGPLPSSGAPPNARVPPVPSPLLGAEPRHHLREMPPLRAPSPSVTLLLQGRGRDMGGGFGGGGGFDQHRNARPWLLGEVNAASPPPSCPTAPFPLRSGLDPVHGAPRAVVLGGPAPKSGWGRPTPHSAHTSGNRSRGDSTGTVRGQRGGPARAGRGCAAPLRPQHN